jgi:hypothetical protein
MPAALEVIAMVPSSEPSVWSWSFASPHELRKALEEYTAFQDGTLLRRYGHEGYRVAVDDRGNIVRDEQGEPVLVTDPEPLRDPETLAQLEMCLARKRSEIDHCMEVLQRRFPHWWRLLDIYYRRGLSLEPRGWLEPAVRLGFHRGKCPPLMRCVVSPGDNRSDLEDCQRHQKHHCHWDRDTFMRSVSLAIARLYDVHRERRVFFS